VFANNATGYLDQVFKPTVDRGIPFSSTHGNVSASHRYPSIDRSLADTRLPWISMTTR
jgi:hypothetical protein